MRALRRIGLVALAASFGAVVHLACTGNALSLGNAASFVSAEVIALGSSSCPAGTFHWNACCSPGNAGCREYSMSPFTPCRGDGGDADLLFADPTSPCCPLDGGACVEGGAPDTAATGSCFYECGPSSVGSCPPVASEICSGSCETAADGTDAGCAPTTCISASVCSCPSGSWPATSQGGPAADGSTVCCEGDAAVCFSIAVGPLSVSSGSGSGSSGVGDAGVILPVPPGLDGGAMTEPADGSVFPSDAVVVGPARGLDAGPQG